MSLVGVEVIEFVGVQVAADFDAVVVSSAQVGAGASGSTAAADVSITDTGGYYTGTDVEAALQEVGADLAAVSGTTNLSWTAATSTVASDTGTDATLTVVDGSNPGLMTVADKSKLDGIESAATADQSAAEILTALLTVDGTGSLLDADLLDGNEASAFATTGHDHSGTYQPLDSDLTTIAGLTPTNGNVITGNGSAWTSAAPAAGGDITTDDAWVAAGDLIVGTGTNTAAILSKGTEGQGLTVSGGAVAWGTPTVADPPTVLILSRQILK